MKSNMSSMGFKRRGQLINATGATVVSIMVLIFSVFAVLYGIATLNPAGFFTAGSSNANATSNLQANLTDGVSQFGAQIPTVFKVLGVVLALSAIVLLVLYVRRLQVGGGEGAGGL
jgi:hypothetical protein